MPGSSNFLVFNQSFSNAESDLVYAGDSEVTGGLSSGIANRAMHNKLFRQVSIMVAAIAQFMANQGQIVSDTDLNTLVSVITNSFVAQAGISLDTGIDASTYSWQNGTYKCSDNVANMPVNSHNWLVEANVYDSDNITLYASDLTNAGNFYQRQKIGGTWQVWGSVGGNPPNATTLAAGIVEIADSMPGTPIVPVRAAKATEVAISQISEQTVLTFTPSAAGNFLVYLYLRVRTGTTVITAKVTYTDVSGAQTNMMLGAQSCTVGSYSLIPLFINATAAEIAVKITADIANQVNVSSSIVGV